MKNLHEVWSKRFVHYINELQKYLKFIVSGHLVVVFTFVLGAAGYSYSEWLTTAPSDFPVFLLVAIIVSLLLTISTPVTLMKNADGVYFLPLETKLNMYIKPALRWTYMTSILPAIAAFIVSIPMLTKIGDMSGQEILLVFLVVCVLKSWSIRVEFNYRWAASGNTVWMDRFVRFLLLFTMLYFWLIGNFFVTLGVICISLVYFFVWQKKMQEVPFPFGHFIGLEQSRMMRFYRFANYFTDVPHIRGMTKRRKMLDVFYTLVPYSPQNAQLYLVMRTFIRTNDYFYLWVRLTALAVVGAIFIPFPIVSMVFTGALAFATVIQLKHALLSGHEFRMDLLFPLDSNARKLAVVKLLRMIQVGQVLFVLAGVLIQVEYTLLMMSVPVITLVISELTLRMGKK